MTAAAGTLKSVDIMTEGGGITQPCTATTVPHPTGVPTYLVLGWEGPTALVPGDGGLSLAGHHAVQVQGLSLGDGWG